MPGSKAERTRTAKRTGGPPPGRLERDEVWQRFHAIVDSIPAGRVATYGQIAREAGLDADGFRLIVNNGAGAGQTVFHLHVHLLAGRPLQWPPG